MGPLGRLLLLSWAVVVLCEKEVEYSECKKPNENAHNFFQYKIEGLKKGDIIDFNDYRGNVVLAVNVATF